MRVRAEQYGRLFFIFLLFVFFTCAYAQEGVTDFNLDDNGNISGWSLSDKQRIFIDSKKLYQDKPSVKLDRRGLAADESSSILRRVPLNSDAKEVELRAQLWAKKTGPWTGANIVLRQDVAGNAIELMISQPLVSGRDTGWQAVRIIQQVNPQAESLVFGAALVGIGEAWVSDIQLWIDGEQVTQVSQNDDNATSSTSESQQKIISPDIPWNSLEDESIDSLTALMQVWGFLKYFHPKVATGMYDWDLALIESIQALLTGTELTDVLTKLLDDAGTLELSEQESIQEQEGLPVESAEQIAAVTVDFYLNNKMYSPHVVARLKDIQAHRHLFTDSVYAFTNELQMPDFARESRFQAPHLEYEMRLLALARLWNIVEYWFPYRDSMKVDFYVVLKELTQQTVQSDSQLDFQLVLQKLLAHMLDGHAGLSGSIFRQGSCQLPFTVRHIEEQVVISHIHMPLSEQDVRVGDKLLAIEDNSLQNLLNDWLPYYSGSNEASRYYGLANDLLARSCQVPTRLTLGRDDAEHQVVISEYIQGSPPIEHSLPGEVVQTLEGGVTYLKVAEVDFNAVDQALAQASESGKLVIDVRGYPSEFILYYLGNQLIQEPQKFARLAAVHPHFPGRVTVIEHTPTLSPEEHTEIKNIVILVDETSFSQSEFSVLAWRELPNTTVIGSTTAGAVGNISMVPLPDGMWAQFTGLRVMDKTGQDVQHTGIVPDIYIKPSIADLQSGRDVVLDTALRHLM